jgi:hypothetical protein
MSAGARRAGRARDEHDLNDSSADDDRTEGGPPGLRDEIVDEDRKACLTTPCSMETLRRALEGAGPVSNDENDE